MTTTFETAKIGDRVWSVEFGWGTITNVDGNEYPIIVHHDIGEYDTYTVDGRLFRTDKTQSLFWGEVVTEAPKKPHA